MKKLSAYEQNALNTLVRVGSICLGDAAKGEWGRELDALLHSLKRKKYAFIEDTDDGPKFMPTQAGRNRAENADA